MFLLRCLLLFASFLGLVAGKDANTVILQPSMLNRILNYWPNYPQIQCMASDDTYLYAVSSTMRYSHYYYKCSRPLRRVEAFKFDLAMVMEPLPDVEIHRLSTECKDDETDVLTLNASEYLSNRYYPSGQRFTMRPGSVHVPGGVKISLRKGVHENGVILRTIDSANDTCVDTSKTKFQYIQFHNAHPSLEERTIVYNHQYDAYLESYSEGTSGSDDVVSCGLTNDSFYYIARNLFHCSGMASSMVTLDRKSLRYKERFSFETSMPQESSLGIRDRYFYHPEDSVVVGDHHVYVIFYSIQYSPIFRLDLSRPFITLDEADRLEYEHAFIAQVFDTNVEALVDVEVRKRIVSHRRIFYDGVRDRVIVVAMRPYATNTELLVFPNSTFPSPNSTQYFELDVRVDFADVDSATGIFYVVTGNRLVSYDIDFNVLFRNEECRTTALEFNNEVIASLSVDVTRKYMYTLSNVHLTHIRQHGMDRDNTFRFSYHSMNITYVTKGTGQSGTLVIGHNYFGPRPLRLTFVRLPGCARGTAGIAQCQPCPAGKFANDTGMMACRPCAPGRFSAEPNTFSCSACGVGRYSTQYGETECTACVKGSYTDHSGSAACTLCKPARFHGVVGSTTSEDCAECPEGFISAAGAQECAECPEGTYFVHNACPQCPGGYFGGGGTAPCDPCAMGRFNEHSGSSSPDDCVLCPAGRYSVTFASRSRGDCLDCESGYVSPEGSRECTVCLAGTRSDGILCHACVPGKFSDRKASTECVACPAGQYNENVGSTTPDDCVLCQAGKYSIAIGADDEDTCVPCPPGTYADENQRRDSNKTCMPCPIGRYSYALASTGCSGCPPGTYAERKGTTTCAECPAGYFTEKAPPFRRCAACPAGKYGEDEGAHRAESCVPCEIGRYGVGVGAERQDVCLPCDPGYANGVTGASAPTACVPCKEGRYSSQGSDACTPCPAGEVASGSAQSACTPCAAGKYEESNECIPCPAGKFNVDASSGSSDACIECPVGSISPGAGLDRECIPCSIGKRANEEDTACLPCSPGFFAGAASDECLPCPSGTVAAEQGMLECTPCPRGKFEDANACVDCPVGKFNPLEMSFDASLCIACPAGYVGNRTGLRAFHECTICGVGRFSHKLVECKACPKGRNRESSGGASVAECHACSPGRAGVDGIRCDACRSGKYSMLAGATACKTCSEGRYAGSVSTVSCEPCPAGAVTDRTRRFCMCSRGRFSNSNTSLVCEECPAGAICDQEGLTTTTLTIQPGYWRHHASTLELRECPSPRACKGGVMNTSDDLCREGHTGPLCNVCQRGYAKTQGLCAVCPEENTGLNIFLTALAPLVVACGVSAMIVTANPSEGETSSVDDNRFSGVSKIAASFFQTYSVASGFDVNWPDIVDRMFSVADYANPSIGFYSAQCSIGWTFWQKFMVYVCMPPVYTGTAMATINSIARLRHFDDAFVKKWTKTSIIVGLFLMFPSVMKAHLRVLACESIGGRSYISTDFSVSCDTIQYKAFSAVAIAGILVYGLGIPGFAFYSLYKYRYRLKSAQAKSLTFLHRGYRIYWWELVVMVRKITIVAFSIFLFKTTTVRLQAPVAAWFVMACLVFHLVMQPYDETTEFGRVCNFLEILGLATTACSLNAGIIFGTPQDAYPLGVFETLILLVVVILNIAVAIIFMFHIVKSGKQKVNNTLKKCVRKTHARVPLTRRGSALDLWMNDETAGVSERRLFELELQKIEEPTSALGRYLAGVKMVPLDKLHYLLQNSRTKQKYEQKHYEYVMRGLSRRLFHLADSSRVVDPVEAYRHFMREHRLFVAESIQNLESGLDVALENEAVEKEVEAWLHEIVGKIEVLQIF